MKNTKSINASQQKNQKSAYYRSIISRLSKKRRKVLNQIIKYLNRYRVVNPSQTTIADHADVSLSTVHRGCLESEELEILTLIRGKDLDQTPKLLPHIYQLNEDFMDIEIRNSLCDLLPALKVIPIILILSSFDVGILKGNYLKECDTVTKFSKKEQTREKQQHLLYEPPRLGIIDTSKYEGEAFSNKMSSIESYIFFVEEREPMELTKEELLQIAQKPKEAVDYARHIVKLDLAAGKQISNLFGYVMGIIERHEQRIPKTGKSEATPQNNTLPFSVAQKETHFDAALKFETRVHEIKDTDPTQWNMMRSFTNPFFNVISPEEQQLVMGIHQDCKCRPFPL